MKSNQMKSDEMRSTQETTNIIETVRMTIIHHDTIISHYLYTLLNPILPHSLLKSLELSGDGRLFFPLILSLLLTISPPPILLTNLLIGAILDLFIIGLLKHIVKRPRPVYNKHMFLSFSVDHWSFPSGHSSRVFFIATLIWYSEEEVKHVLGFGECFFVCVWVWAVVTSLSRVLLGRHFVLDVFVGTCLGVLLGMFVFRIFNFPNLYGFWLRD